MKEKPYKTNKTSLDKFLETRPPKSKNTLIERSKDLEGKYFVRMAALVKDVHKYGTIEDQARLEAVGCEVNGDILVKVNGSSRVAIDRFNELRESDKYDNMWRGQFYTTNYVLGGGNYPVPQRTLKQDDRYTVAGKTYAGRAEFLLSRTALGRALL